MRLQIELKQYIKKFLEKFQSSNMAKRSYIKVPVSFVISDGIIKYDYKEMYDYFDKRMQLLGYKKEEK